MRHALQHRGPDSEGSIEAPEVSLGVRRLSIIDLVHGQQPLYNEDRSLALVVNGEIYNFIELTAQLESCGHRFHTRSDGETILHLYEEYGTSCVDHLRGMFAFALWDVKKRQLLLARDRIGEKPLYVYESNGQLIFASELKALLSSGLVPFELDPQAIDQYFHYGYVPEPLTPLKGVRKLPAAHILIVQIDPWNVHQKCYWHMDEAPVIKSDPAETIRNELETISKIIIRSDVPVGVALSGGLDSGAVLALAAKQYPGTLHAFCVGYPGEPEFDERRDARTTAEYLKVPFHEVEIRIEDVVSFFPDLIYWTDDPVPDISGTAYYAVMNLARQHNVPVMLLGHGGDELFWGYPWVTRGVRESNQKSLLLTRKWLSILSAYFDVRLPDVWSPWGIRTWLSNLAGLRPAWSQLQRHRNSPPDRLLFYDMTPDFRMALAGTADIYSKRFVQDLQGTSPAALFSLPQPWDAIDIVMTQLISGTYLLGNGIAQADRLSMACSVEARLPLVDYRLFETVIGLRKAQRDFVLPPKTWLKDALKNIIPDWILNRPKRGFQPPVHAWHRAIFERYGDSLQDGYLVQSKVLNEKGALELSDGPFPKGAITPLSYKALVLELWCRRFSSLKANEGNMLFSKSIMT